MPKNDSKKLVVLLVAAACTVGCTESSSNSYDSSDPVNCITIMGVARGGSSDPELRRWAYEQADAIASKHGGLDWINQIKPDVVEFAKKLEADNDAAAAARLLNECSTS